MVRRGYDLDPEEIALAVEWLKLNPPDDPVPIGQAIKLGKPGRPKKGERKPAGGRIKYGSNNRDHIITRLERDGFAELAAKVEARESPSPLAQKLQLPLLLLPPRASPDLAQLVPGGGRRVRRALAGAMGRALRARRSAAIVARLGRPNGRKRAVPGCGRRDSHGLQSGSSERDLCNARRRARRLCGALSPPGYYISGDPPGTREVYCGQWSVVPTACVSPRAVY